jgi:hypothetical protein
LKGTAALAASLAYPSSRSLADAEFRSVSSVM